jgi:hypothetical protein
MMKKILMAATAATALTATPAMASTSIDITATAEVQRVCQLRANVRSVANGAGDQTIGFDPATGTSTVTTATSAVNLASTAAQTLASLSGFGNGGCRLEVNTLNNFKLQNGNGGANREVPFNLTLSGGGANATGSANNTVSLNLGTAPGQPLGQTRSLSLTFPTAANPVNLAAGTYQDVITVTILPNV